MGMDWEGVSWHERNSYARIGYPGEHFVCGHHLQENPERSRLSKMVIVVAH